MYEQNIIERFWSKVEVRSEDECWEWRGSKDNQGYGSVGKIGNKWEKTHRIAYRLSKGDIPNGMCVCHSCDNRSCCNPSHLWLGSHKENMRDMAIKKRAWGTKLDESMVKDIRKKYSEGQTLVQLSSNYGLSFQHVGRIVNRKCWKQVP